MNKQFKINNLKKMIKNVINKNQRPVFSLIRLNNQQLLDLNIQYSENEMNLSNNNTNK